MALLFSAVTVTAGDEEIEFTVGGIPRECDDLVGWTAFDSAHSLYAFGRRYFAVYEQLRDKNKRFADKPAEGIRRAMEML